MDTVDCGLFEFAAFVVGVAGQTHIDPVNPAIVALTESDDVRSGIVVIDLRDAMAYLGTVVENDDLLITLGNE